LSYPGILDEVERGALDGPCPVYTAKSAINQIYYHERLSSHASGDPPFCPKADTIY
jgi:hypothetical protein